MTIHVGAPTGLIHRTKCVSLDDLVGAAEQRWRNVDAELFRRLEIDQQFERGGLHNRHSKLSLGEFGRH